MVATRRPAQILLVDGPCEGRVLSSDDFVVGPEWNPTAPQPIIMRVPVPMSHKIVPPQHDYPRVSDLAGVEQHVYEYSHRDGALYFFVHKRRKE